MKWHWLQSIWARLRPLVTSAAWRMALLQVEQGHW